ncbi:MAG: DUF5688 family protein [Butyribacter sp.]|nr:DUF5688 family protein [bacterium]MDY3855328.1 DUF5688 family protein [Butyribacter sp.]
MEKEQKTYSEFRQMLFDMLSEQLPGDCRVERRTVRKNNAVEMEGFTITSDKSRIAPHFNIASYYQKYRNGQTAENLVQEMLCTYEEAMKKRKQEDFDFSFANCQDKIFIKLVSRERNQPELDNIPNISFLDLSIIFHILFSKEEEGICSVQITNKIVKDWGITTVSLLKLARKNTEVLFPKRMCSMYSMLHELLGKNFSLEMKSEYQEENSAEYEADGFGLMNTGEYEADGCGLMNNGADEPYVITNEMGINGATVILYPNMLEEIGEALRGDFYLLPSSIHEMIVLSAKSGFEKEELRQMVNDANETCVEREEILSDCVYYYSVADRTIRIL